MYARQYNKNISFSIFSTNGILGFFEKGGFETGLQ
jgi:hypothetical protein